MSPAEAAAIEYEEPDWRERYAEHAARWTDPLDFLARESAFEATLTDWRKFHCDGTEPGKRIPAPAVDGIIALAHLGIMAPRSRDYTLGYQFDEHMWLSITGEQWRIQAIEDRILILAKDKETMQIDLSRAKWNQYVAAASKRLAALEGEQ